LACCECNEAFPDFEQIDYGVSDHNPQLHLGILCSILLSYVDISHFFTGLGYLIRDVWAMSF